MYMWQYLILSEYGRYALIRFHSLLSCVRVSPTATRRRSARPRALAPRDPGPPPARDEHEDED